MTPILSNAFVPLKHGSHALGIESLVCEDSGFVGGTREEDIRTSGARLANKLSPAAKPAFDRDV